MRQILLVMLLALYGCSSMSAVHKNWTFECCTLETTQPLEPLEQANVANESLSNNRLANDTPANDTLANETDFSKLVPEAGQESPDLQTLRQQALELINAERGSRNLSILSLANNSAAQMHAEEMLRERYLSHWDRNGLKPYMRYTLAGGRGISEENVGFVTSARMEPAEGVGRLHDWLLLYSDVHKWEQKNRMLNPLNTNVSIGLAYDNRSMAYVELYEADQVKWDRRIAYTDYKVSLSGSTELGMLNHIEVRHDEWERRLSPAQLRMHNESYGYGRLAAIITRPDNKVDGARNIEALYWRPEYPGQFNVGANINSAVYGQPGVYTFILVFNTGNGLVQLASQSMYIAG
ncbi:MAG: CAP domain-containing protein [Candidatus Diapherotrites archaeon]|uniref:CAP domain-containing protein n=1 Tax=Candidatus Iainarchaeum sp. TaxID=3101447 RepID=A0A8T3YKV7_9ARCH|nr:CAP domain-containing protein [Candidatus Diapherotrites archaeon]